eukprot:GHVR01143504.1.p1 GENE.GHVR01143504.1~~GHVR01143504.1.p1  ORF type:complete len:168 (+),score=7.06 GHVR01143504.1:40-543(+)
MVTKKTEGQVITDELYYNDRAELCPLCVCETLNVMGPLELLFKVNGKTNGEIMRHDHEKYNIQSTWDKLQGNLATLRRNSAGNLATSRRSSAVGRSGNLATSRRSSAVGRSGTTSNATSKFTDAVVQSRHSPRSVCFVTVVVMCVSVKVACVCFVLCVCVCVCMLYA